MKKIFVVFPVHNGLEQTIQFMESLGKQSYQNYEVIVCDDGSVDGTSEYLKNNYPAVKVVQGTGDLWWTGGINMCVERALQECETGDFILTINNDVILDDHYLQQKITRSEQYPNTIIGSLCVFMSDPDLIETSGIIVDFDKCDSVSLTKNGEKRTQAHTGIVDATTLPGKGVLIPVKVFKEIGLYDQDNFPHYHADTDFILRAFKAGYRVVVDFDSLVYSDVNYKNMTLPSNMMTVKNIVATFRGPYSQNNWQIKCNYAKKHFGLKWRRYLVIKYIRIVGGLVVRYLRFKLYNISRRHEL